MTAATYPRTARYAGRTFRVLSKDCAVDTATGLMFHRHAVSRDAARRMNVTRTGTWHDTDLTMQGSPTSLTAVAEKLNRADELARHPRSLVTE